MKTILKIESIHSDFKKIYGANFRIVENKGVQFPVCTFNCSLSSVQTKKLLDKQRRYARLLTASPELFLALKELVNNANQ
jgi:hypothetical protein